MSFFRHQDLVQNVNVVEADDRMAPSKHFNCDTGEGYDDDCDDDWDEGDSQNLTGAFV